MVKCPYCGQNTIHAGICPMVAAIEYHENGTIKRVELRSRIDHSGMFPVGPGAEPPPSVRSVTPFDFQAGGGPTLADALSRQNEPHHD